MNLSERFYNKEELTIQERRRIGAGNIRLNRIQCKHCKDIITSDYRHDFKFCKCGKVAVDGGSWYARRVGKEEDYKEMMKFYKDKVR